MLPFHILWNLPCAAFPNTGIRRYEWTMSFSLTYFTHMYGDFGDLLTFSLVPAAGQSVICQVKDLNIYNMN